CVALDTPISEPISLIVPPMLVGLPIVAAGLAVLAWARRPGSGRAIHLDRRLALRGFHPGGVVAVVAGAQAVLGALAFAAADGRASWQAAVAVAAGVI